MCKTEESEYAEYNEDIVTLLGLTQVVIENLPRLAGTIAFREHRFSTPCRNGLAISRGVAKRFQSSGPDTTQLADVQRVSSSRQRNGGPAFQGTYFKPDAGSFQFRM